MELITYANDKSFLRAFESQSLARTIIILLLSMQTFGQTAMPLAPCWVA